MPRKVPQDSETPVRDDTEDVRDAVRRAARALAERHETLAPTIAEDSEFASERGYERVSVLVAVAPLSAAESDTSLDERARRALEQETPARRVVRRYRREPSPLVRDSVRGWRTGRLESVLGGNFDVIV